MSSNSSIVKEPIVNEIEPPATPGSELGAWLFHEVALENDDVAAGETGQ